MTAESAQDEARMAKNEAAFRAINEHRQEINDNVLWSTFVCECADETCEEQIELTPEEYERVRQTPTYFVVMPSGEHVVADVERVTDRQQRYWVVEKLGIAAAVTIERDPRASPKART